MTETTSLVTQIIEHERKAEEHEARADEHKWKAAELIATALAEGKSQRALAQEIGKSQSHVSFMEKAWLDYLGNHSEVRPPFNAAYQAAKAPVNPQPEQQGTPSRTLEDALDDEPEQSRGTAYVSHNGGENEWYTPPEYIEAARLVMGTIDLDPASSDLANATVRATVHYTEANNGLEQPWKGNVWMNPPYAQPLIAQFCTKLATEFAAGRGSVTQACVLVNSATETRWFIELSEQATALCLPRGRVRFWHPEKEAVPLQGQAVLYLGHEGEKFRTEFAQFGGKVWHG